jgi:hypothetical protein
VAIRGAFLDLAGELGDRREGLVEEPVKELVERHPPDKSRQAQAPVNSAGDACGQPHVVRRWQ